MTLTKFDIEKITYNDILDELFQAHTAASDAATLMKKSIHSFTRTEKLDTTDVTDIDVEINKNIIARLTKEFPYQVLGEEISTDIKDIDGPTWVIDPIDGTFPYTAGLGISCVAIALVVSGTPVISVVADPWTETIYEATVGSSTLRNAKPVSVTNVTSLKGARIGIAAGGLYEPLRSVGAKVIGAGASVRLGASVADGGLDALCFGPGSPWDIAASVLLIERAGGTVLAVLDGEDPIHYAKKVPAVVAGATPELAEELRDFWAELLA